MGFPNMLILLHARLCVLYRLRCSIYLGYSWPPHRFAADLRGPDLPPIVGRLQDGRQRDAARRRPGHRRESGLCSEGSGIQVLGTRGFPFMTWLEGGRIQD